MAQIGPLRECQDFIVWSPIRRKLLFACASGKSCEMPSQWWPASVPVEFYSSFQALFVRRSLFHFSRRVAGIRRFSGSAAALVTLSISRAILNHVSIFTLSFPTGILWTCCMASWCLRSSRVVCPSSLRRSS
jgi:hypothetical protein